MDWPRWHETRVFRPEPLLCPSEMIAFSIGLPSPKVKQKIPRMFASQARAVRRESRGSIQKPGWPRVSRKGRASRRLPGPRIAGRTVGGEVLPNVLPLPRKSSPKQDEPRAIRMSYVIEIEGTTWNH